MRVDPLRQGLALLAAALLGLGAGLLYDLLRPPRWRLRAAAAFALDALYCFLCGAALFLFAMSWGEGRLGLAALVAAWAGFLAYHWTLSPLLLPFFVKVFQYLDATFKKSKEIYKKIQFSAKKYFKN